MSGFHAVPIILGVTLALAAPARADVLDVPSVPYPTIQSAITAAAPGDTVRVAPGDYPRTIQVDKAIRIEGAPGTVRVAGLTGSLARVANLVFTTEIAAGTARLVTAGDGLALEDCRFEGSAQGVFLTGASLRVTGCTFANQLLGVFAAGDDHDILIESSTFTDCAQVLSAPGEPVCPDGDRAASDRCAAGPCRTARIQACTVLRSDDAVILGPDWDLTVTGSTFQAVGNGIEAAHARVRVESSTIQGTGGAGTGLDLTGCSGTVRNSTVSGFQTGVRAGDGGCAEFTTVELGGALSRGNTLGNAVNLFTGQPEAVPADYNYWGAFTCLEAQATVTGQTLGIIADMIFFTTLSCTVPARPTTWGRLKRSGP